MKRPDAQGGPPGSGPGSVVDYYEQLADRYDQDRFENPYGRYVDAQERRVLARWLAPVRPGKILDLACGTGRMLDLATHGLDASAAMVRLARRKHPDKPVHHGPASRPGDLGTCFDAIFCLHLFMHLPGDAIAEIFRACHAQLRPGGRFIFDVPLALRRRITGFRPAGWHGGTALSGDQIGSLQSAGWTCDARRGVLLFPIHRLPKRLRWIVRGLDDLLGMTPVNRLASYGLFCFRKTA